MVMLTKNRINHFFFSNVLCHVFFLSIWLISLVDTAAFIAAVVEMNACMHIVAPFDVLHSVIDGRFTFQGIHNGCYFLH